MSHDDDAETYAEHWRITWVDCGREPRVAPDPAYPDGKDIDASHGATPRCRTLLPYPALRVGYYLVVCTRCDLRVAVTTAGRVDDPRSLTVSCLRDEGGLT